VTSEIPTLNLRNVQAAVGRDDNNQPTIVISDGTTEIVLGGGEDRDVVAGARRIVDRIWDYQLLVAARRDAAYGVARLAARHGVDVAVSKTSIAALPDDGSPGAHAPA
jgi:hypothetical protein